MIIRPSQPADRDRILRFIEEMGFNPRDARTWDGLRMCAMTAWEGDELIGALPLEPRVIQSEEGPIETVHETVVAVRPESRNRGIGSALQEALFDSPPGGAMLASVFREDPNSPAYRWYIRNGFVPAMRIESWFKGEPRSSDERMEREVWECSDPRIDWQCVEESWDRMMGAAGGVISRRQRPLRKWLEVHPYLRRYQFLILIAPSVGYALLGVGKMHSETTRVDVLELCGAEPSWILKCVEQFAARNNHHPIRWPLAKSDPLREVAQAQKMTSGWSFDMLVRPLNGARPKTDKWRYAGTDYA